MSPPQELAGSSNGSRGRNASVPDEPLLAQKAAAVERQEAALPDTTTSDPDALEDDIDQMMDELESGMQNAVTAAEAENRKRKLLEQELKDNKDKLDAMKNAPRHAATPDLSDDDDDVEDDVDWVNEKLGVASGDVEGFKQANERLTQEAEVAKARITELEETEKSLRSELDEANGKNEVLAAELATVKNELATVKDELATTKAELAAVKAELEETKGERERLAAKLATVEVELEETKVEKERLVTELDTTKAELNTLNAELDTVKAELNTVKTEKANVEAQLAAKTKELLDELKTSSSLRGRLDLLQKQYNEYVETSKQRLRRLKESLKTSKNLLAGMGYR